MVETNYYDEFELERGVPSAPLLQDKQQLPERHAGTNAKRRLHRGMSEFEGKAENMCSY